MIQPLWAINSSLLLFFMLGQLALWFLQAPIPRRASLEPDVVQVDVKKNNVTIDIQKIYMVNDLFGTYTPAPVVPKVIQVTIPSIPDAPAMIPFAIPIEAEKQFIAPLAVVLKGVMYSQDRPEQSVAIIQFQDSKEEMNYRQGQLIIDAQILKIYPNRVIVVRSNGQQETLYLCERDAGKDFTGNNAKDLTQLQILQKEGIYYVPVDILTSHVKSLGQFIDLLDMTTVYQKGKSIGCRIGKADKDSLGFKLGFMYDDIVNHVDGLPVTDIASRVLVFDHVIQKKIGDSIVVKVDRGGKELELHYNLIKNGDNANASSSKSKEESKTKATTSKDVLINENVVYDLEEKRKKLLEQKVKLAPTAHQLEKEERRKLFEVRRREMLAKRPQMPSYSARSGADIDSTKRGLLSSNDEGVKG